MIGSLFSTLSKFDILVRILSAPEHSVILFDDDTIRIFVATVKSCDTERHFHSQLPGNCLRYESIRGLTVYSYVSISCDQRIRLVPGALNLCSLCSDVRFFRL
jgi:hypothetical protein